jgi:hypothetical protein
LLLVIRGGLLWATTLRIGTGHVACLFFVLFVLFVHFVVKKPQTKLATKALRRQVTPRRFAMSISHCQLPLLCPP